MSRYMTECPVCVQMIEHSDDDEFFEHVEICELHEQIEAELTLTEPIMESEK